MFPMYQPSNQPQDQAENHDNHLEDLSGDVSMVDDGFVETV